MDSPSPAAAKTYAARQRDDALWHSSARSDAFVTVIGEPERLASTVAPASDACADGGTGTRTFALPGGLDDTATVVNEDRTVKIDDGRLTDDFPTESTYHVYRIALRE